jgi:hypothetical protein
LSAACAVSVVVVSGLHRFGFVVFSGLRRFGRLFSAACAVSVVVFSGLRRFGHCFQQLALFRSCYAFLVLFRFRRLSRSSPFVYRGDFL